jgi:hypothetical protein
MPFPNLLDIKLEDKGELEEWVMYVTVMRVVSIKAKFMFSASLSSLV